MVPRWRKSSPRPISVRLPPTGHWPPCKKVHYVAQDPENRKYILGNALTDISRQAELVDLASIVRRPMRRLADVSGDTIFFVIPEGAATVCIARELGDYPVRTLTQDRGDRIPMGVGGGALAIYSILSDARRKACNKINANWIKEFGLNEARLEEGRDHFVKHGYALNRGMVYPETSAIGLPVIDADDRIFGAFAIGSIISRMTLQRINDLLFPALKNEVQVLRERLRDFPGRGAHG